MKRVDLHKKIIDQPFDACHINVRGGNVIVLAGPSDQASLRVAWKENDSKTLPKFFVENNILKVEALSWRAFIGQKDSYVIEVTVPAACAVDVKMFAGTINLEGMSGDVTCSLKAGEIKGSIASKYLKARVWAGDIKIILKELVAQSVIDLKCVLGDIKLFLPRDIVIEKKPNNKKIINSINADIRVNVSLGGSSIKNE